MKWHVVKHADRWLAIPPRLAREHAPFYEFKSFSDVLIAKPWEYFKTT